MAEKKPEARVVSEVCSMCGLDWKRHGMKPTTETCIRLLASDLAAANERANRVPISYPVPYPVYPRPFQYYPPIWTTSGTIAPPQKLPYVNVCSSQSQLSAAQSNTIPQMSNSTPRAVLSAS